MEIFDFVDIRTLLLCVTIFNLLIGIILISYGHSWRYTFNGIFQTGWGLTLIAIGVLFAAISEGNEYTFLVAAISIIILVGFLIVFWGLGRFIEYKHNFRLDTALLIIGSTLIIVLSFSEETSNVRIGILSLFLAYYSVRIGLLFLKELPPYNKLLRKINGILFFVFALANIIRIVVANQSVVSSDFEYTNTYQAIYIIAIIIIEFLIGILFILQINNEIFNLKDRLLSAFAHDIKNPMNVVVGFSDFLLLKDKVQDPEAKRILKIMKASGVNGYNLINNMLQWSKFTFHRKHLALKEVTVRNIVDDAMKYITPLATEKEQLIDVIIEKDFSIWTDVNILQLILRNLASNSIKYSEKHAWIEISVREMESHVLFSVKDNGIGMDQDDIDDILKENPINSTLGTNKEIGTGLGLTLCIQYLKLLDSKLNIQSEPGKGSVFSFKVRKMKK